MNRILTIVAIVLAICTVSLFGLTSTKQKFHANRNLNKILSTEGLVTWITNAFDSVTKLISNDIENLIDYFNEKWTSIKTFFTNLHWN